MTPPWFSLQRERERERAGTTHIFFFFFSWLSLFVHLLFCSPSPPHIPQPHTANTSHCSKPHSNTPVTAHFQDGHTALLCQTPEVYSHRWHCSDTNIQQPQWSQSKTLRVCWAVCQRSHTQNAATHVTPNAHIYTSARAGKYTRSIWCHWTVSSGLAPVRAWQERAVIRRPAVLLCLQGPLSARLCASSDNVSHTQTHMHRHARGEAESALKVEKKKKKKKDARGVLARRNRCVIDTTKMYPDVWLSFRMRWVNSDFAGLCDINEGSATSEDRCKSPTSGNMSFSVIYQRTFVLIGGAVNRNIPITPHAGY